MKQETNKKSKTSKKCSQICEGIFDITRDFDVFVAMFEATINANGLWSDYYKWFERTHLIGAIGGTFSLWKSWARTRPPQMWSTQAFIWEATDIEYPRWFQVDKEWQSWLLANIYN